MKLLVASFLLCIIFFAENVVLVSADETQNDAIYDAGYELIIEDGNIVEVSKDGTVIISAEYIDGVRVVKNGQYLSEFTYEDIYIVNEIRDGINIEYFLEYDENYDVRYAGFIYEGNTYDYIWDNEGKIVGIKDESNNEIVRYDYDSLQVVEVLKRVGDEWYVNCDEDFIGNFNKIRSYGAYFDDETGWYYSNGVYNDVCENKIVGLKENNPHFTETNPFSEPVNEGIMLLGYEEDDYEAEMLADELLSNSNFNAAKSSGYYSNSSTSTEEIIARLIYGENNKRTLDQRAIAWVLLNRYHYNPARFGDTFREIAANPNEFNGVNSAVARQAQNPSDSKWSNAVYLACLICTNNTEACWNSISPKPTGITNQTYFRSASYIGDRTQVYEENGVLYAYYADTGVSMAIENACIAGVGTATTEAGLKALCTEALKNYNVYFYHKN